MNTNPAKLGNDPNICQIISYGTALGSEPPKKEKQRNLIVHCALFDFPMKYGVSEVFRIWGNKMTHLVELELLVQFVVLQI